MEAKAIARYVRVSPRKARIVVDLIRGKSVVRAREILAFTNRGVAETVEKTLNSAVANAENIYYASPNRLVYDDPEYIDDMGEDTMAILYPNIGSFRDAYNRSAYRNLDQDTLTYVNTLWETLKIN